MKYRHHILCLLTLALCAFSMTSVAQVQPVRTQQETEVDMLYISNRDVANYDSLIHSYYLRKYTKSVDSHYKRTPSQMSQEFDLIPDSVLAKRLRAMPTIVPMTYNSDVRAYIRMYVRLMEKRCDVMISLSEFYFPMFGEVLARYGVPDELKYLTIVESALNPQATSRVGAAGLWQFMYRTGLNYDLEVNSLVDNRRDPYLSTVAAARYLKDLYKIYGDWTLAIASYNCGPGNVNKAIARSGGKRDFWQIYSYLPRETRGYIPAFIAANYVMNYYHEHGIRPHKIQIPYNADTIHLRQDAYFCHISKFTGIQVEELKVLNPQYRADIVPVSSGFSTLNLPTGKLHTFILFEDSIYRATKDSAEKAPVVVATSEPERERIVHKVKSNETMTKIANRYGVSVNDIKRWNKKKSTTLKAGERIVIYRRNPNYKPPVKPAAPKADTTQTATKADSRPSSAAADIDFSVDPEPIDDDIPGAEERLEEKPAPKPAAKPAAKPQPKPQPKQAKVYHTVKKGETLFKISQKYGVTIQQIKKNNNLKSDNIAVGQKLLIK
ncbi:MAG: LysM peptidoglycan-binding domain-containing protein [Bacteroidales bacterium]|nr:LysM peptidoglycan-binding domain-containing protein [Bacteroidales bacterium]